MITVAGQEVATQRLEDGRLLIWADQAMVPGLGALPIRSVPGEPGAVESALQTHPSELETETLRLRVNGDGTLASLFDKEWDREILAGRGNQLWLFTDIPRQFDAWDIDASYGDEGIELCCDTPPQCVENGPLRGATGYYVSTNRSKLSRITV